MVNIRNIAWVLSLALSMMGASPRAFSQGLSTIVDAAQARQIVSAINQRLSTLRVVRFTGQRPAVTYPAEGRAWLDGGGVVKLEAIERDDSGDVVTEFYFSDRSLFFVYQAVMGFVDSAAGPKQVTRAEERFYFQGGKLVRWLSGMSPNQSDHPPTSKDFAEHARLQLAASTTFLNAAHAAARAPANAVSTPTASSAVSNTTRPSSFCTTNETVLFSCPLGNKVVSVCTSKGARRTSGYVQYRIGKSDGREPLELSVPDNERIASQAVTGENTPFAGGGGSWLRFRKANYSYVVYEGIGRWGPKGETREKAGVVVERDGRMLANLKCTARPTGNLAPDWFEKMGVKPKTDEEFLFP